MDAESSKATVTVGWNSQILSRRQPSEFVAVAMQLANRFLTDAVNWSLSTLSNLALGKISADVGTRDRTVGRDEVCWPGQLLNPCVWHALHRSVYRYFGILKQ
jgi:hypothetical protein